ncbi:hypothetical protein Cme02nite_01340 [Catellatospora methionotrophica]|uniref:Uncharacterized protein n=1 Tax=Catellatospora methionotrophica TaxID=121620 RepID=A0A8J3KZH2_9ACTN|nr:hypothetical protein Cme02nite_01340 [Catellatospora methionotrophica]
MRMAYLAAFDVAQGAFGQSGPDRQFVLGQAGRPAASAQPLAELFTVHVAVAVQELV